MIPNFHLTKDIFQNKENTPISLSKYLGNLMVKTFDIPNCLQHRLQNDLIYLKITNSSGHRN